MQHSRLAALLWKLNCLRTRPGRDDNLSGRFIAYTNKQQILVKAIMAIVGSRRDKQLNFTSRPAPLYAQAAESSRPSKTPENRP
jgi:hypothetical protein